jgi:hypothetical protein
LFAYPELFRGVLHVPQYARSLKVPVLAQRFQETRFAEFFSTMASCLRDPIGLDTQHVPSFQLSFGDGTLPIREEAKDRGGRVKSFNRTSLAEQYGRVMPAIDVMQRSRGVGIPPQKKCGITVFRGVLVEVAIHRGE